jgi:hypothetical protein
MTSGGVLGGDGRGSGLLVVGQRTEVEHCYVPEAVAQCAGSADLLRRLAHDFVDFTATTVSIGAGADVVWDVLTHDTGAFSWVRVLTRIGRLVNRSHSRVTGMGTSTETTGRCRLSIAARCCSSRSSAQCRVRMTSPRLRPGLDRTVVTGRHHRRHDATRQAGWCEPTIGNGAGRFDGEPAGHPRRSEGALRGSIGLRGYDGMRSHWKRRRRAVVRRLDALQSRRPAR